MLMPRKLLGALDRRIETGPYVWSRDGEVVSVTGDYSSDMPLVELDDPDATQAPIWNYSAHTLTVGAKVWILVQGLDQRIVGKHPST